MTQKVCPPAGTTHYRLSPFGYDYFYKAEVVGGKLVWAAWGIYGTWEGYKLTEHDPDIWPIQCRNNACGQLKHALETLVLFSKPTKTNAAALQNAHQVLAELNSGNPRIGRLPPVGTVCEQQTWVNRGWRTVEVIAHFNGFAVCAWEESPGDSQVELAPPGDLRIKR